MALKGRVHKAEGERGGADDTPGSGNETYRELIRFEIDLIRPVFGFEGEEEEPERQTLSGNSSEEYGQMQEQCEAEGWEIERVEESESAESPSLPTWALAVIVVAVLGILILLIRVFLRGRAS